MKAVLDTIKVPDGYAEWRSKIENLIEKAKLNAAIHVNTDMLSLYWSIGSDIIRKKKSLAGDQLSVDLYRKTFEKGVFLYRKTFEKGGFLKMQAWGHVYLDTTPCLLVSLG